MVTQALCRARVCCRREPLTVFPVFLFFIFLFLLRPGGRKNHRQCQVQAQDHQDVETQRQGVKPPPHKRAFPSSWKAASQALRRGLGGEFLFFESKPLLTRFPRVPQSFPKREVKHLTGNFWTKPAQKFPLSSTSARSRFLSGETFREARPLLGPRQTL